MIATPKYPVQVVTDIDHGADAALGHPISTTDLYWLRHSRQRKPIDPLGEDFAAPVSSDLEVPAPD